MLLFNFSSPGGVGLCVLILRSNRGGVLAVGGATSGIARVMIGGLKKESHSGMWLIRFFCV